MEITDMKKYSKQVPAPADSFKLISKNLRQCSKCNKFIKGSKSNFNRHYKTHEKTITMFICFHCDQEYTRRDILKRHCRKIHGMEMQRYKTKTEKRTPDLDEIKPVKPWQPPFECTLNTKPTIIPKFRIVQGQKNWLAKKFTPEVNCTQMIKEMTVEEPLSPLPDSPFRSNENSPTHTISDVTICQDEKDDFLYTKHMDIMIYSIYGIFN
jgi:hypothetical protein